jgi:hypothetical protein
LNALLVRLHVQESLDLTQGEVLAVALSDQLVKCAQKLKSIAQDLALVQASADAGDDLGEEV